MYYIYNIYITPIYIHVLLLYIVHALIIVIVNAYVVHACITDIVNQCIIAIVHVSWPTGLMAASLRRGVWGGSLLWQNERLGGRRPSNKIEYPVDRGQSSPIARSSHAQCSPMFC